MKVLMINGSPRENGNTMLALSEMKAVFEKEGIETEVIQIGKKGVRGCIACGSCFRTGKCVFDDDLVNETAKKFEEADGLVIGSPVYYAQPNGSLSAFVQRLFFSSHFDKCMKVGACVVADRRGGAATTFDALNKYFTISEMPVASAGYWNMVYGSQPGEAAQDLEGMVTVRTLARNMAFLMKAIALGKEQYGLPEKEPHQQTNFIR